MWTFPLALFWVYHKIFNWKIILSVSAKVLGKQKANHATWSVILYFNIFILNSKYPYRYWWVCAFIYINYKCLCQTFPYNTIHLHYDSFECLKKLKYSKMCKYIQQIRVPRKNFPIIQDISKCNSKIPKLSLLYQLSSCYLICLVFPFVKLHFNVSVCKHCPQ